MPMNMKSKKIFSIDAETDGLYGNAFAIAVTIRRNGEEISQFQGRLPNRKISDPWVKENVLPALELEKMPVTHITAEELEESFWKYWIENKEDSIVIAHCGSPVESGLFRRCVERNLTSRMFDGPYPAIHDVATLLLLRGKNPASVDDFNMRHDIKIPFKGSTHHPMYDATSAAVCWEYIIEDRG